MEPAAPSVNKAAQRKVDGAVKLDLKEDFLHSNKQDEFLSEPENLFSVTTKGRVFWLCRPPVAAGALPQIASLIHGPVASSGLRRTKPAPAEGPTTGFRSLRRRPWRKMWTWSTGAADSIWW